MITPFKQNGETDFNSLSILTDKLISNGINYLVVLGTTAETPTLSKSEKSDVVSCVVDACGKRVPVMVGAGGNDTRSVVELVKAMKIPGVDSLFSAAVKALPARSSERICLTVMFDVVAGRSAPWRSIHFIR